MFNHAAFASLGPIASDIPGVSIGRGALGEPDRAERSSARTRVLRAELAAFDEPELESTPYFIPRAGAT